MSKPNEYAQACMERVVPGLVGLTITGGAIDDSGEFWGVVVEGKKDRKAIRKVVFVLSDPEGNGPGFLEIQNEEED